jgi:fatty-acyl-CoA synthase
VTERSEGGAVSDWSFARVWEAIAGEAPDRVAIVCGDRHLTYAELDERANRLAHVLSDHGIGAGASVAIQLTNCPEYLETVFAALKLGAAPVNVNYRYVADEIAYILANSDADALVHHDDFAGAVGGARFAGLALAVAHDGAPSPYEDALGRAPATRARARREPSGDDLILLYTGGTTGLPKGVMWRNDDLYVALWQMGRPGAEPPDPVAAVAVGKRAATALAASPLMHGTALFVALSTLAGGGTVVLIDSPRLDVAAVLDAVARERVEVLSIVGDAFARPLLAQLDAAPGRWDLSSLKAITSSGVMWSPEAKRGFLRHAAHVTLLDSMGASEGIMSRSTTTARDTDIERARFAASDRVRVIDDAGRDVVPGSGEVGLLAVGGRIPLGYHKDDEKTARTFRVVDGSRYSIPGDYATVDTDGSIRLLGRGSACINTGGEKVYPEEIEEIVKSHPAVFDAVVVGVPDERWGERVVALVQPRSSDAAVSAAELARFCRDRMAGYKRPKEFFTVESLARSPAGKVDYPLLRALAAELADRASR